jgi:hypothetical protein
MANRREFPKPVMAEIVRRALHPKRGIVCEGCGLALGKKPYNIDHTIPDAMFLDKARKLTAADGKLLGKACCHDPKTHGVDLPAIAKVKRVEAKNFGVTKPAGKLQGQPFQTTEKAAKRATRPSLPPRQLYQEQIP